METRCGSLLLSELRSLLRFRQSQRVATLMTAARRTTSTTAVTTILILLIALLLQVEVRISRGTGRRGWRRAHSHTRKGRLVPPMRVLLVRSVHRNAELLLGHLGELEGIHLRRNASYRGTALHLGIKPSDLTQLLRLQQAHVNILLVCRCNLLLLLLK